MKSKLRYLLVRFGLWLSRLGLRLAERSGWRADNQVDDDLFGDAIRVVRMVERSFPEASGEFRRRDALRVLLNRFPAARERDLALAIEMAVQRAL